MLVSDTVENVVEAFETARGLGIRADEWVYYATPEEWCALLGHYYSVQRSFFPGYQPAEMRLKLIEGTVSVKLLNHDKEVFGLDTLQPAVEPTPP